VGVWDPIDENAPGGRTINHSDPFGWLLIRKFFDTDFALALTGNP